MWRQYYTNSDADLSLTCTREFFLNIFIPFTMICSFYPMRKKVITNILLLYNRLKMKVLFALHLLIDVI